MKDYDIHTVLKNLPHRYPFLLVDRVLELEEDDHIRAIKNVTINEPFFQGHFPARPVMPGVLIVEALAQVCALLAFESVDVSPTDNVIYYFVGIDEARFKKPVEPGDQIVLKAKMTRKLKTIWKFDCSAEVDGEVACAAKIMITYKEVSE